MNTTAKIIAKTIPHLNPEQINNFYNRVEMNTETGCHEWKGSLDKNGYGLFYIKGKKYRAHRISWYLNETQPDETLTIDHLCRVRNCINPDHLDLVTKEENLTRMHISNYRFQCPRGHELTGNNLIAALLTTSGRACRSCDNAARRARHNKLTGQEREQFIQKEADERYEKLEK